MSKEYWNERDKKSRERTALLLEDLPKYVGRFEIYISDSTSALTRENYIRDLTIFFDYVCSELELASPKDISIDTLSSLSVDFLSSYSKYLSNYTKSGKSQTMKGSTKSRRLSALRTFYGYLYDTDQIPQNQMTKIHSPKLDDKEIIRLDDEEATDLLKTITTGVGTEKSSQARSYNEQQSLRDMTIVSLLLNTGMRVSELVGLDLTDIDLKRASVRVIRKGHSEYSTLYYNSDMKELLENYLDYRNKQNGIVSGSENALFLSSRKQRLGVRAVEKLVKKYTERSGIIKPITPHKLRSTFGTKLYKETGDIKAVADTLGHKSIETTSRRYVESDKERREALREVVRFTDETTSIREIKEIKETKTDSSGDEE